MVHVNQQCNICTCTCRSNYTLYAKVHSFLPVTHTHPSLSLTLIPPCHSSLPITHSLVVLSDLHVITTTGNNEDDGRHI